MFLSWTLLVACSILIGLSAFFWALHDGQFSDQNRARYLPLVDDFQQSPAECPPWKGRERYFYLGMGVLGVFFFAAAAFLGLTQGQP